MATQVPGLSEAHYLGYFMNGLIDIIRSGLRIHDLGNPSKAMDLARFIESDFLLGDMSRPDLFLQGTRVLRLILPLSHIRINLLLVHRLALWENIKLVHRIAPKRP
ncbi:unnamed protein product [Dovyalis caffra]|uniref:Uncharacterized protein n=1 Tax=Dovyalis caffra TaxID=77055 RepID=A0AAV1SJC5_9ROSI|nr:unnamed protein product [Dovyalis caffra]